MAQQRKSKQLVYGICFAAMFMALTVGAASFSLPLGPAHVYFVDAVIYTAAIILDPVTAFIVGGFGSFLGDLFFYPAPMWVSLFTHGLQALVVSLFAHKILKNKPVLSAGIGVSLGAVIMVAGYALGKAFIYGSGGSTDANIALAVASIPGNILQTVVGAVVGMVLCFGFKLKKPFEKYLGKI